MTENRKKNVLRDTVHGSIPFPDEVQRIVGLAEFQRLRYIKQLGFAYLVYPDAEHTRFSHSIGTWFLAMKMIEALLDRFTEGESELLPEDINHFSAASLLHDIGHAPFSHALEDIIIDFDHEKRARDVICETQVKDVLNDEWNVSPNRVASIISGEGIVNEVDWLFNNILTGIISPDTMDYLLRDAHMCGVPYGVIDVERLLHTIWIDPERREIAIDDRGVAPLESLLFSRYHMYRAVYLHHTVRIAQCMAMRSVEDALGNAEIEKDELLRMNDEELKQKLLNIDGTPKELMTCIVERRLFKRAKVCDWSFPFVAECYSLRKRRRDLHKLEHEIYEKAREEVKDGEFEGHCVLIDIPGFTEFEKTKREIYVGTKRFTDEAISPIGEDILRSFEKCWKLSLITLDDEKIKKAVEIAWDEVHPDYLPKYA
jgi:hypothetical protein